MMHHIDAVMGAASMRSNGNLVNLDAEIEEMDKCFVVEEDGKSTAISACPFSRRNDKNVEH